MTDTNRTQEPKPKHAPTLYVIASVKIGKGLLLLLTALGIFALAGKDLSGAFEHFLRWIHVDPERRFFANIGDWLDTITPENVRTVASGTMIFGVFLLTCGIGLACRAKWAIWVVIGESAFFIPIEIYELVRRRAPETDVHRVFAHPKIALAVLLAANVAIVWYLYKNRERLFRHHHHAANPQANG
jgi:uncharacterized membrane protein (DUF2068 family)